MAEVKPIAVKDLGLDPCMTTALIEKVGDTIDSPEELKLVAEAFQKMQSGIKNAKRKLDLIPPAPKKPSSNAATKMTEVERQKALSKAKEELKKAIDDLDWSRKQAFAAGSGDCHPDLKVLRDRAKELLETSSDLEKIEQITKSIRSSLPVPPCPKD